MSPTVPDQLSSERLFFRAWRREDAALLLPILEANVGHLDGWIPPQVASPAPLPELGERLTGFAADFATDLRWRYGIFSPDQREVFGEVSLFPRSQSGRTAFAAADRVEIGYFLRKDVTGRGYATEASRAMVSLASALPGISRVEIHCDPRNAPSAAIPRRLGFELLPPPSTEHATADRALPTAMVWVMPLTESASSGAK